MNPVVRSTLVAFILLILIGCNSDSGGAITRVLDQCAEISRRAVPYNNRPGAQADFIAREFQKLNVTNCPADFRMAFQAHISAWQQAAPIFEDDNVGTAFLEGFAAGATEDPRYIGQAGQRAVLATQQINFTYHQLTQIAAKYGARIPRSVAGETR